LQDHQHLSHADGYQEQVTSERVDEAKPSSLSEQPQKLEKDEESFVQKNSGFAHASWTSLCMTCVST